MKQGRQQIKLFVTSLCAAVLLPGLILAQEPGADLDALYERLRDPETRNWEAVEDDIWQIWAQSGSEAIDLLFRRGHQAMEQKDLPAAVDHFSAAIDHAPEFAEAYNARATVFYEMERFGLSLADIEMTLALNPRHFGAMTGLALILESLDRPDEALRAYRAVAAIHPHQPNVKEAIEKLEQQLQGTAL